MDSGLMQQTRLGAREKTANLPPPVSIAPLGQAVVETLSEGIVVLDLYGRLVYANQRARRVIEAWGDAGHRSDNLRERLLAAGGRTRTLKQGTTELGELISLADRDHTRTRAERERQAILDTLEVTRGKLAETARSLGISRTTLWRRLRAYGLRPGAQGSQGNQGRA